MHVTIDDSMCQGHARCAAICPQIFTVDDEGFGHVALPDVPAELRADAELAARNCPEGAILVSGAVSAGAGE